MLKKLFSSSTRPQPSKACESDDAKADYLKEIAYLDTGSIVCDELEDEELKQAERYFEGSQVNRSGEELISQ